MTVKVTDQGDGTLKAEATEGANPTVTNTYGTVVLGDEAAKTDAEFTKEFNGWSDADGSFNNTNFNFTLKAVTEGAPAASRKMTVAGQHDRHGLQACLWYLPATFRLRYASTSPTLR